VVEVKKNKRTIVPVPGLQFQNPVPCAGSGVERIDAAAFLGRMS